MPAGTKTSTSKIALILVLIPIGMLVWWCLPLFMPIYRWTKIDFPAIASKTGVPLAQLQREIKMTVRYHPRGKDDPTPWQIISSDPTWLDLNPDKNEDETNVLVRCNFISDFTGSGPSALQLGSGGPQGWRDRYFTCTAWRFPAASIPGGPTNKRPIVLFRGMSFNKLEVADAMRANGDIEETGKKWSNDDDWEDRADNWAPEDRSN